MQPAPAQSVFTSASDGANLISDLSMLLIVGACVVLAGVMVLLVLAVRGAPRQVQARHWLVGGGIVLPGIVLALLLGKGLSIGQALSHPPELRGLEVEVIAHRWWWEIRYRDPQGNGHVVLANELHLPVDCAAVLTLTTADVIHSFWVPALAGKVDMIPGRTHRLAIHASHPGRYRGQCAEYCGTQHANMALEVVVESPQQFRSWLMNQASAAREPAEDVARRGRDLFAASGCATCHAIRGTEAAGRLGPDLTHLASRRSLGAATLPNDAASLARWIGSAQHLKPGNLMPSMPMLDESQLAELATYLGTLH